MNRRREAFARWALLCTLAWAVLAMHHVGSPSTEFGASGHVITSPGAAHAMHAPAPEPPGEAPPPVGLHDLLHLCMAVLCTAGIALVVRLLLRVTPWVPSLRPATAGRAVPSPARPPPWGRELLHSAGVLRL